MLYRVLGCSVLSIFLCLPQSFAGQLLSSSDADAQPPSITHPRAAESDISVVRLRAPRRAVELYNHALDAFNKGKIEDAEKHVEKALKIYPSYPDALVLRGGIHLALREWVAAEQDFQASIDADPSFVSAYIGLADSLNEELRFDDALAVSEKADRLTPGAWRIRYETSRALIGKHLYARALNVVEEALRVRSPKDSLIRLAKAHALAALGKFPEAAAELRAYLSSGPGNSDDPQARDLLNRVEAAIGGQ